MPDRVDGPIHGTDSWLQLAGAEMQLLEWRKRSGQACFGIQILCPTLLRQPRCSRANQPQVHGVIPRRSLDRIPCPQPAALQPSISNWRPGHGSSLHYFSWNPVATPEALANNSDTMEFVGHGPVRGRCRRAMPDRNRQQQSVSPWVQPTQKRRCGMRL